MLGSTSVLGRLLRGCETIAASEAVPSKQQRTYPVNEPWPTPAPDSGEDAPDPNGWGQNGAPAKPPTWEDDTSGGYGEGGFDPPI